MIEIGEYILFRVYRRPYLKWSPVIVGMGGRGLESWIFLIQCCRVSAASATKPGGSELSGHGPSVQRAGVLRADHALLSSLEEGDRERDLLDGYVPRVGAFQPLPRAGGYDR